MDHLTEDKVKAALRDTGFPVPDGAPASSAAEAREIAEKIGGSLVIKALVPTGRRGKAGAIAFADSPDEAVAAAEKIIGSDVNGFTCRAVYIESKAEIAREIYLSFILEEFPPKVLLSVEGGVEIEEVHRTKPEAIVTADIDPLRGLPVWDCLSLWEQAGLDNETLAGVARLTAKLYEFFVANEGLMLELNPIALDADGKPILVGAMLATEDTMFEGSEDEDENETLTEGERRVMEANRTIPHGMVRYKELDGDIGLWVGGGGASLYQHDLILAAGGRPANHTDASTQNPEKVRAVIDVILDNPKVKGLLVSWHFHQMARIDPRVTPVIEALKERKVDLKEFPVVIRMFGPGEEIAREAAKDLDGLHYLPQGTPMTEAVKLIVELTGKAQ